MRKIGMILLLALLLVPTAVEAQGAANFERVTVKLWPEHDRPEMLVICDFVFAPNASLPPEVTLRIPAAAAEPYVVAIGPEPRTVSDQNVDYRIRPAGDWVEVTIRLRQDSRAIRLEYYDPSLLKEDHTRRYSYVWPGDYAVQSLQVSFQLPVGATNLLLTPPLSNTRTGPDGLRYYEANFGPLTAGEPFSLNITYQKSGDDLNVSALPIRAAGPLEQRSSSNLAWNNLLPWVLGILGFLLVLGGLTGFFQRQGRRRPKPASRGRRTRARKPESAAAEVYCHQCGKRAQSGDRFCRACGARLRRSED